MKLNFKALVASLVLCSTPFSTLPVCNNSVLAMNPIGRENSVVTKNPLIKAIKTVKGYIIYDTTLDGEVVRINSLFLS